MTAEPERELSGNRPFDPMAIIMVNRLIERSKARVVISSAWSPIGKDRLHGILKEKGLVFRFHEDWSSFNREGSRKETIERWLARHPEVKKYAIIDDNPIISSLKGAVLVDFEDGFLLRDYRHACDVLGVPDGFGIKPPPAPINRGDGSDYRNGGIAGNDFFAGLEKMMKDAGLGELKLNTDDDRILDNVRENIRRQHPQVRPHGLSNKETVIVGGGWSLDDTFDDLKKLVWKGANIVACNGAGNWLMERNIRPHAIAVLDARPSNVKFVEQDIPGCKYFLASQCDPSLFEACKDRDTYIWHCLSTNSEEERKILDEYYVGNWNAVPGTCCVGFRSVCLLRMLGFIYFHIFGVDSCYGKTGEHHAYAQPENDEEETIPIRVAGKDFVVSAWQYSHAIDFAVLTRCHGHQFFFGCPW